MMLYNDLHHTPTIPPKPKRFTLIKLQNNEDFTGGLEVMNIYEAMII